MDGSYQPLSSCRFHDIGANVNLNFKDISTYSQVECKLITIPMHEFIRCARLQGFIMSQIHWLMFVHTFWRYLNWNEVISVEKFLVCINSLASEYIKQIDHFLVGDSFL